MRDYIMEKARPLCDQMWVDRMGNLLCRVEGRDPQAGLALVLAHMDEVGLMVQGINDDGLISYQCVGGIDPRVLVSKRVRVGEKGIPGVIRGQGYPPAEPGGAAKAPHPQGTVRGHRLQGQGIGPKAGESGGYHGL